MLKTIELENYRCFEKSVLIFRQLTVIVGSNNSGKSTIIEALRIVSLVAKKMTTAQYIKPPSYLGLPQTAIGIKVNLDAFQIDLRTIIYNLRDDINAKITATFNNKAKIVIHANPDIVFANIYNTEGDLVKTRKKAQELNISEIYIMPQLSLIREEEKLLNTDTIKRYIDTRLSSRHFRNELLLYKKDCFEKFKTLAEATWPGLRIQDLEYKPTISDNIYLFVYDGGFTADIGSMGSGLQMWLQIIWFISRCSKDATIILDEPDVYMHPDMQSRILRIVRNEFKQSIIATHSVEIISKVEPYNIVNVDKTSRRMQYAGDSQAVQKIIDIIGSSQNLSLIKLGLANKCIFVEGKDITLLDRFHSIYNPSASFSLKELPTVALGGWSRFNEALGAARLFYEQTTGAFKTICILDRDYHLEEELDELYVKAKENHLQLIIWNKKELENYLIIPKVIFRAIQLPENKYEFFLARVESIIDLLKDDVISAYTDQFFLRFRSEGAANAYKRAKDYVESRWNDLNNKLSMVNGKTAISMINDFLKKSYNKACSRNKILHYIQREELDSQLIQVIDILTQK